VPGGYADAQLRRVAARATKIIAERFGPGFGVWFGAGYPRSGTTFLCQVMSSYLDLPFVRHYRLPVAMPCVIHSHWLPTPRMPRTIYVVRDGRDVVVSRYLFEVESIERQHNVRGAAQRRKRFNHLYGLGADLADVRANLPKFIEAEMTAPALTGVSWPRHIEVWLDAPSDRVSIVKYEALRADACDALAPAFAQLLGETVDVDYLRLAGARFDVDWQLRRAGGGIDNKLTRRESSNDWPTYFNDEANQVFDHYAGAALQRLGYEIPTQP
jgi:hypothetical protein